MRVYVHVILRQVLAHTLAAVVMLRHADVAAALSTFLDARSRALEELLQSPDATSSRSQQQQQQGKAASTDAGAAIAAERLFGVLALVLRTVEAAYAVFDNAPAGGAGTDQDSLCGLLRELERLPVSAVSSSPPESGRGLALPPLLSSAFPNAPVLQRHLPSSILEHRPSVSTAGCSPEALRDTVEQWTAAATKQILAGFSKWISSLSEAKALAELRQTGRRALAPTSGQHPAGAAPPASSPATSIAISTATSTARELQHHLERAIEARLAEVYRARLDALVARVRPSIEALLLALPESKADTDVATFLFESPLAFPTASLYAPTSSAAARKGAGSHGDAAATDPFEAFLSRVGKRVEGRSPLLDKGVTELEHAAREIRADLDSWLSAESQGGESDGDGDARLRQRLRDEYVVAAGEALVRVADAIGRVVQDVRHGEYFYARLANGEGGRSSGGTPPPKSRAPVPP